MHMNNNNSGPAGAFCGTAPPSQQQLTQQTPGPPQPPTPTSAEGTQQFCLRWNSYPATVATQLAELRLHEDFVDVTLACDGRQLLAHKLILSACSPYFMQLFKSTPCKHPVIFLRDVGFRQLQALLDFMYVGEVNVSQVELPALLRTAEALQVRGLADTTTANNNNNNTNNSRNCPPQQQQQQQPKPTFSPTQYGQMIGVDQSVMNNNNTLPQQEQPAQPDQNDGPCMMSSNPCSSSGDTPNNHHQIPQSTTPQQQQQHQQQGQQQTSAVVPAVVSSSMSSSTVATTPVPSSSSVSHNSMNSNKFNPEDLENKEDEDEENTNNDFEMLEEALGTGVDGNLTEQLEDTGQIFPDDPLSIAFGEMGNDNGNNSGEEESTEVSDDDDDDDEDDGECKEFTYQSDDASYSQEGMGEGEGLVNPNGENIAGPSNLVPLNNSKGEPGAIIPKHDGGGEGGGNGGTSSSARNRLSRSLWPPGIPYHGPQQCPYCTRVLSNVGNWRKHVLTMHFAREKIYKCRHCSSSFRTAEYLQKHYVRVHNYPQKMTRRKYVDQA